MKIMTTYKTKIRDSHRALANTVGIYRQAVDFLIGVALEEWNALKEIERSLEKQRAIECVIHHTKSNPCPKYDFDSRFGKFPSYLSSVPYRRKTVRCPKDSMTRTESCRWKHPTLVG
ncbi:hypothetical protein [Megasphaera elsdenii]|uniref:hypothetical protein n=1 Tax=Megasphaera elsdenii TaxID=907 RepID=UPI00265EEF29|nr:hypothetical protein [Megasphaera elsdenii]